MHALLLTLLLFPPGPTIKNFDQQVSAGSPLVVIAPPPGKIWRIQRASFAVDFLLPGTRALVFEEQDMDPKLRTNLIYADISSYGLIPIVGGYSQVGDLPVLNGQDAEIELHYPARLVISVTGLEEGQMLNTYTRATIKETDEANPDSIARREDRQ